MSSKKQKRAPKPLNKKVITQFNRFLRHGQNLSKSYLMKRVVGKADADNATVNKTITLIISKGYAERVKVRNEAGFKPLKKVPKELKAA